MKNYKDILVFSSIVASFSIITFFTSLFVLNWNQIDPNCKTNVMGFVIGGTLSLGALSLTVLAYAISEARTRETATEKAPYRKLAMIAYLITPLSLTDAIVSLLFVLSEVQYSFEVSIIILYIIVVALITLVSAWIQQDL